MDKEGAFEDFTKRFKLFINKHPNLITTTLSNIFTMRLIGNKTHGDLAEIAISEFINQYMYDFRSLHVGKDLYRAKAHEEDILVTNEISQIAFPISLKAYGDGPLQLSTDKHFSMFPRLEQEGEEIIGNAIADIFNDPAFSGFDNVNVLPLIYNEKSQKCNILVFNYDLAKRSTARIIREEGKRRKHAVYRFYDDSNTYICEVRYGSATANALQRGLWTHTKNGIAYFDSLTNGWISYAHNVVLVSLFSHALISSSEGHHEALNILQEDVKKLKASEGLA